MTRDEKGRFVKGHAGGPGRPARKTEEEYLTVMSACVSAEDWKAITLRAVLDAKRGDPQARKWLSDYLQGLPVQRVEQDINGGMTLVWDVTPPPKPE